MSKKLTTLLIAILMAILAVVLGACGSTQNADLGESFFDSGTTALVPVDGEDTYYTQDQAENFEDVSGGNTEYVIDPEECLADNFALAMVYGMDGPEGKGYTTPEIIEGIIAYLSK